MLGFHDNRPLASILDLAEARALHKAFGYLTAQQLLEHYPRTWSRHGSFVDIDTAEAGDIVTCVGTITRPNSRRIAGGKTMFTLTVTDGQAAIDCVFFNSTWVTRQLTAGTTAMISGKLAFYRGRPQLSHPDFVVIAPGSKQVQSPGSRPVATGGLGAVEHQLATREYIAVYPASKGLTSWRIMGAVTEVLDSLDPIPEPLGHTPRGMVSFDAALRGIHDPDERGPYPFLQRLKYNEALALQLVMALRRNDTQARRARGAPRRSGGQREQLVAELPFSLTTGQQQVIDEISADLARSHPMSRLLQGEVGSGKTIVALIAMLQVVDAGLQCAMLAPTEVLAAQHARSLDAALSRSGVPASVVLLTGSMSTAAKRKALLDIVSGQADIVVGTHALIQAGVEFFDLGLVVVDEQHRFGVEQRDRLRDKGRDGTTPHLLVMTATPIPRTIAMTVFAELEVSTLRELPGGRKPISTSVVPTWKPRWLDRAWERIREEVAAGRQAYVVCPRIEGDGGVLDVHEQLSTKIYPQLSVGLLHGRLSGDDKDAVMARFAAGRIDILVSTTVIEVGVDVPNATIMLVLEAEHFGVSQLHQLRGRVGRGGYESWCLLVTDTTEDTDSFRRLTDIAATTDGFRLAELDLLTRQEGDVLGSAQSGRNKTVKLLSIIRDGDIIDRAHRDAEALVARDPARARRLAADVEGAEFLDKS